MLHKREAKLDGKSSAGTRHQMVDEGLSNCNKFNKRGLRDEDGNHGVARSPYLEIGFGRCYGRHNPRCYA